MSEIQGIQQLVTFVVSNVEAKPDVLDKLDFDKAIDIIADRLGVPPEVIVSSQDVAKVRDARAQAQAQAQKSEEMRNNVQVAAQAAKNMGAAPLGGGNALEALAGVQPQGNA